MQIELFLRGIERLVVSGCVPMLIYIGYRLFVLGASGEMQIIANKDDIKAKITNVTPGALCFILGMSLGAYVMYSNIEIYDNKGRIHASYMGSENDQKKQLTSSIIANQYTLAALRTRKILSQTNVTLDQVKNEIANTPLLKKQLTETLYKDLQEIEAAANAGDASALIELENWKERYLR
ncbi:MAG: hypothetical protein ACI8ZB_003795 [Desulforhopalus sp.]|jgi:hypothetical protein